MNDDLGMSDYIDAVVYPNIVQATAHVAATAEAPTTRSADELLVEITPLNEYRLFALRDGTGATLDLGVGDDFMDAFVALTIRLEDGPDDSMPNT